VSCELCAVVYRSWGWGGKKGVWGVAPMKQLLFFCVKKVGKRVVVARKFGLEKLCSCKEKEVKRGRNCFPFQVPASLVPSVNRR
jgi:hypothetical protein